MSAYSTPIMQAVLFFPFIALLLTVPYMLFSYHRYGAVSLLRSAIIFSFVFYLMCAYFLVILPLPSRESVAQRTSPTMQLIPFHSIRMFLDNTVLDIRNPQTYLPAMRQSVFFEPLFNICLTVPFGIYLSYYFRKGLAKTVLFTFFLTLFFELTQLSGLYGIYPRPYRLFDVDDLMTNTLGGLIGYAVGTRVSKILPSREEIDESSKERAVHVGYLRRSAALVVDLLVSGAIVVAIDFVLSESSPFVSPAVYFLYFVGIQMITHGRTPGKMVVSIRTASDSSRRPFFLRLLLKYTPPYLVLLFLRESLTLIQDGETALVMLLLYGMVGMLLVIDFGLSFRRGKRLWYEVFSRTRNVSSIQPGQDTLPGGDAG